MSALCILFHRLRWRSTEVICAAMAAKMISEKIVEKWSKLDK